MGTSKTFKTGSQCSKILNHLKDGNTLTVEQARELKFGANLRSRISDLINAGYNIKSETVKFSGGFITRYSLKILDLNNTYCKANKKHFKELNKLSFKNGKSLMLPNYKYFTIKNDRVYTTNFITGSNMVEIEYINEWFYC